MTKSRLLFRSALAASLVISLSACSDGTANGDTAPVTLLLTDAPGDVRAAVVTISEIYLQGNGRTVLMSEPATVNLLDLVDQTVTLVADVQVPAGSYSQLRLVITGGYIEVEDEGGGSSFYASSPDYAALPAGVTAGQLQMPSFDASGLKVVLDGNLDIDGEENTLLVDFDVRESFGHDAGTDRWVMNPVITGTEIETPAES